MSYQMIFQRYEMKYLLTQRQKLSVLEAMEPYMSLDQYGRTIIRNIYFDTDSYRLIRRSIERPAYKEKLRLRSYRQAQPEDPIFVELKKKYQSVVYKRRLILPQDQAMDCLCQGKASNPKLPEKLTISVPIITSFPPRYSSPMSGKLIILWTAGISGSPLTRTSSPDGRTFPSTQVFMGRPSPSLEWC